MQYLLWTHALYGFLQTNECRLGQMCLFSDHVPIILRQLKLTYSLNWLAISIVNIFATLFIHTVASI